MINKVENNEKLHIGYLIPNLGEMEKFLPRWQLLQRHNKNKFVLFAYVDDVSAQEYFSNKFNAINFLDISEMNIDFVTQVIKKDKLNILVDISSFKHQKFLNILARKSAPLQICFVGLFNSTKLNTVDYLFTDKYCDPLDQKADYFKEKLYRLPQTHYCYNSTETVPVQKKPAFKRNNYITFGSFHNFTTLNDDFLVIWGEILKRVPDSRLLLKSRIFGSGYGCEETRFRLKRLGFPIERVELFPASVSDFELYSQIDILLGTYPYQSGNKLCETIYHGIPAITMVGNRHSVRIGYSILKNIALEECIAFDVNSYINKTVRLAENKDKLMYLYRNLQERLAKSAIMDERRFVGNVERAYENIWQDFIETKKHAELKVEIRKLLYTVKEGLLYIQENVKDKDKNPMVSQMIDNTVVAFENIETVIIGSPTLSEYSDICASLLKKIKHIQKIYIKDKYEATVNEIQEIMLVTVDNFIYRLK